MSKYIYVPWRAGRVKDSDNERNELDGWITWSEISRNERQIARKNLHASNRRVKCARYVSRAPHFYNFAPRYRANDFVIGLWLPLRWLSGYQPQFRPRFEISRFPESCERRRTTVHFSRRDTMRYDNVTILSDSTAHFARV